MEVDWTVKAAYCGITKLLELCRLGRAVTDGLLSFVSSDLPTFHNRFYKYLIIKYFFSTLFEVQAPTWPLVFQGVRAAFAYIFHRNRFAVDMLFLVIIFQKITAIFRAVALLAVNVPFLKESFR